MEIIFVTLALAFGSESLLFGALFASIPLLIHLIYQRTEIEVRWAAMRFLLRAAQKRARRSRLEQIIVLLLRVAVLLFFALSLARPSIGGLDAVDSRLLMTHHILVFDATYSMQFHEDADATIGATGKKISRFEKAKNLAINLIRNAPRRDVWSVVPVYLGSRIDGMPKQSSDQDTVIKAIQAMEVSEATGNISIAVPELHRLALETKVPMRSDVVVFTDMQPRFLKEDDHKANSMSFTELSEFRKKIETSFVNVASGDSPNLSIIDLRCHYQKVLVGRMASFSSVVRNSGGSLKSQTAIDLLVDGNLISSQSVEVPPGEAITTLWQTQFSTPGQHLVEVRIEDDRLRLDNQRMLYVTAVDNHRIAIVANSLDTHAGSTAYFIQKALASGSNPNGVKTDQFKVEFLSSTMIAERDLNCFDGIVLCDPCLLDRVDLGRLSNYVRSGGGIVIFPSEDVGTGWLQDLVGGGSTGVIDGNRGSGPSVLMSGLERFDFGREFNSFSNQADRLTHSGLESVLIFKHLGITPSSDALVVSRFTDSTPAIVKRNLGSGTVVFFATSPDVEWSTWGAIGASFVPLIHEAVNWSAGRVSYPEPEVGGAFVVGVPQRFDEGDFRVNGPSGESLPFRLYVTSGRQFLRVEQLTSAGAYLLRTRSDSGFGYCFWVNPISSEGLFPVLRNDHRGGVDEFQEEFVSSGQQRAHDELAGMSLEKSDRVAASVYAPLIAVLLALFAECILARRVNSI